jgi:anaerobic magnesium-protoporphyrin IX monomethyl ester cyclase
MNILLINPAFGYSDDNIWYGVASIMPPLGLASLAAVLENAGHKVRILDAHAEKITVKDIASVFRTFGQFDLIGISAATIQINSAMQIARIIKDEFPETKIVLGGVHPTVLPEEVISEPAVDIVVQGEGEQTILELAAEKDLEEIRGIYFKHRKEIVQNDKREIIKDINSLPSPAYHLLPMNRYYPAAGACKRTPAISVLATRGCPGRCTFCNNMFGSQVRVRSGRLVADEVMYLQDRFGIKEVCFYDDTFTSSKKEVFEFCRRIKELDLDLTWVCFSRVDQVNEKMLTTMKESGCHQILYGIESASPIILKNIRKNTNLDKTIKAVQAAKKAQLNVRASFMLGNPGETIKTMEETLKFAIKLDLEHASFNITTPFPGTELFEWADRHGYLNTKNWDYYDLGHSLIDLPTVTGQEIKQFYRKAYRRFYLRPKYIFNYLKQIRSLNDFKSAMRGMKAVVGLKPA